MQGQFAVLNQLHADAVTAAIGEVACSHRAASDWRLLEAALSAHGDERLRRIVLAALISVSNRPAGWTEESTAKLESYRKDDSVLVAAAATFTFPPELSLVHPDL